MQNERGDSPRASLGEMAAYLAIAFAITWGLAAYAIFAPEHFARTLGPLTSSSPVFYLAVWAPNIAAVIVTASRGGWPALRDLFGRLLRWRAPLWVWFAAIFFYPALVLLANGAEIARGGAPISLAAWGAAALNVFSVSALLLGPLGEELGWRGFLLPRVLTRVNAAWASLIVGAIWMLWHVPAFLISTTPQAQMAFPVFMVGGVMLSVFVTWVFVNARQSVLIAGIAPHAVINACGGAFETMTWTHTAALVAGAAVVLLMFGTSLRREAP